MFKYVFIILCLSLPNVSLGFDSFLQRHVTDYFTSQDIRILKTHLDEIAKESEYNIILDKPDREKEIDSARDNITKLPNELQTFARQNADLVLKFSYASKQVPDGFKEANPPNNKGQYQNKVIGKVLDGAIDYNENKIQTSLDNLKKFYQPFRKLDDIDKQKQFQDYVKLMKFYKERERNKQFILSDNLTHVLDGLYINSGRKNNSNIGYVSYLLTKSYLGAELSDKDKKTIKIWYDNNKDMLEKIHIENFKDTLVLVEILDYAHLQSQIQSLSFKKETNNGVFLLSNGYLSNISRQNIVLDEDYKDGFLYEVFSLDNESDEKLLILNSIISGLFKNDKI